MSGVFKMEHKSEKPRSLADLKKSLLQELFSSCVERGRGTPIFFLCPLQKVLRRIPHKKKKWERGQIRLETK